MSTNQQTRVARLARLIQGKCPLHGLAMVRVYSDQPSMDLFCCPLADCGVTAQRGQHGTIQLAGEFALLLTKTQ